MRSFASDRRGASAVEFALISPFLLLLVGAILAYGTIFATSLSLQQLAAEAARASIGGLNDAERQQLAQAHVNAMAGSYPMLRGELVSFEFDAGTGANRSSVTLRYDLTGHPAYVLDGLIPLPSSPLSYSLAVTDGDGSTS